MGRGRGVGRAFFFVEIGNTKNRRAMSRSRRRNAKRRATRRSRKIHQKKRSRVTKSPYGRRFRSTVHSVLHENDDDIHIVPIELPENTQLMDIRKKWIKNDLVVYIKYQPQWCSVFSFDSPQIINVGKQGPNSYYIYGMEPFNATRKHNINLEELKKIIPDLKPRPEAPTLEAVGKHNEKEDKHKYICELENYIKELEKSTGGTFDNMSYEKNILSIKLKHIEQKNETFPLQIIGGENIITNGTRLIGEKPFKVQPLSH